jgi:signal peptidase
MGIRSWAGSALTVGLIGFVLLMLFGQVLGQPLGLGFVVTGSMAPTLEPGDGFVAVPTPLAGDIEEGDVVTFRAEEIQGGGLTTHRVVGETNRGYITRGDANPFTDQDGGEPPVRESDVVAVALQFDGSVLTIPALGTVVQFLQGIFGGAVALLAGIPILGTVAQQGVGSVMITIGVVVIGLSYVGDLVSRGGDRSRSRTRSREGVYSAALLLVVIVLLITLPATASMVVPSGNNQVQVVSSQSPSDNPLVIEAGGEQEITYNSSASGFLPRIIVIEPTTEGVTVSDPVHALAPGGQGTSQVTVSVPVETGSYQRGISQQHYVWFLPKSLVLSLHSIHPWVAILVIDLFLATVVTLIYLATIGLNPIRLRSTSRNVSLVDKLKQYLP